MSVDFAVTIDLKFLVREAIIDSFIIIERM